MKTHHALCPKHRWSAAFYSSCQCWLIKEAQDEERRHIFELIQTMHPYEDGRVSKGLVLELIGNGTEEDDNDL